MLAIWEELEGDESSGGGLEVSTEKGDVGGNEW